MGATVTPYYTDGQSTLFHGNALDVLRSLPSDSVHCCVTSPPYFGLRSYLPDGHTDKVQEIGGEETPAAYIAGLVEVFREVRQVLHPTGTCWINCGDSYAANRSYQVTDNKHRDVGNNEAMRVPPGMKPKDLMMMPARLAIALQDDGWWLRSEIVWAKSAPMPESVTDRPTSAHEMIYLFAKRERYFYDALAVAEPMTKGAAGSTFTQGKTGLNGLGRVSLAPRDESASTRNLRNVWHLGPDVEPAAHFATFPREIPRRAILAGTSEYGVCSFPGCGAPWVRVVERETFDRSQDRLYGGTLGHNPSGTVPGSNTRGMPDRAITTTGWRPTCQHEAPVIPATVLDPFCGSGRTLEVAKRLGRRSLGIDLNDTYLRDLAIPKLQQQGMFFEAAG